jgi:hypothetical protein
MAMHRHGEDADQAVNEQRGQAFIELLVKGYKPCCIFRRLTQQVQSLSPQ